MEKQYLAWAELILYNNLLHNKMKTDIDASKYDDADIKQRLSSTESAITTLNGEGLGSIKKKIDDAFNDFATKISDDNVVNTYKELIDYCATHSAEAAEMAGDIAANEMAISTLETYIGKLPEGIDATTIIEYINAKISTEIASIRSVLDSYKLSNDDVVSKNTSAISILKEKVETVESIEFLIVAIMIFVRWILTVVPFSC